MIVSKLTWIYRAASYFFIASIVANFFQIDYILSQVTEWSGNLNQFANIRIELSDIFLTLAFILYVTYIFLNPQRIYLSFGTEAVKRWFSICVILMASSYLSSIDKSISFAITIQWLKFFIVYLMIINKLITTRKILMTILAIAAFQSCIGILQFIFQSSVGLGILGETNLAPHIKNIAKFIVDGTTFIRAYGTLPHANILGGFLSLSITAALYAYITNEIRKVTMWVLCILFSTCLVLTFSRTAWLALLLELTVLLSIRVLKIRYSTIQKSLTCILIAISILQITGGLNFLKQRILQSPTTLVERTEMIKDAYGIMRSHPNGVGLGNYTNALSQTTESKLFPYELQPAHNIIILVGTEMGIGGIIILILGIFRYFFYIFEKIKITEGKHRCYPLYFALIITSSIILLSQGDHYLFTISSGRVILTLFLGLSTNMIRQVNENTLQNVNYNSSI